MKIHPVRAESFLADRRTDMKELIVVFRNFSKAPKGCTFCQRCINVFCIYL